MNSASLNSISETCESSVPSDSVNLDVLRSLAVLLVLADHLGVFYQWRGVMNLRPYDIGHLGVLLFFVHTSFVLMLSLERQLQRMPAAPLFWGFMIKRCFRIYPLCMAAVATVYFLKLPLGFLLGGRFAPMSVSVSGFFANLLLLQNVSLSGSILGPLWSLPLEMQMYFLLPALFVFANRFHSVKPLIALWSFSIVVAIAQSRISVLERANLLWYIPNFLPGIVAFKLLSVRKSRWPSFWWPLSLGCLVALFALFARYEAEDGWLICLLSGVAIPSFSQITNHTARKVSHNLATYSFGIYLCHFFCIWFAFVKLSKLPQIIQWVAFFMVIILLPVFMYHFLEKPMIEQGRRLEGWLDRRFQQRVRASASLSA